MADQPKNPDTPAPAEEAAPKSKMPMMAIVAIAVVLGGGVGAAVIGPMVAKKMGKVVEAPKDSAALAAEEEAKAAEGAKGGKEGAPAETVRLLENLVLNPAGSGGSRFLLLSVAIETGSPKAMTDITAHDAELRDIILTTLGTKTVEELTDMSVRDSLKTLVQDALNARFGKTAVKRLYFPQFVVQ